MNLSDRESCIILNLISGIGAAKLSAMREAFGSISSIFKRPKAQLARVPGIGDTLAGKIIDWEKSIDLGEELSLTERGGAKIITCVDEDYPAVLKEVHDHPLCLYVRGELPDFKQTTLAVVGSRRVTSYGRRMAEQLSEAAAYAGWTIVSGLAYGIDAIAHQACLNVKGRTVAVLGGGLARIHPQNHIPMAREIIEAGAVISEFPMNFSPTRRTFPMRNRIISGLSQGVLVIEAGFKSGSLITANFALEQGRQIFAVPGQADCPQARGCNSLIKQGAKLTENFDDILAEFEFLPGFGSPFKNVSKPDELSKVELDLDENETRIVDALKDEAKSVDKLAAETSIGTGKLLATLMGLEMKKVVVQEAGKTYRLR